MDVTSPVLSPDGRWIVFGTYAAQKGNLWVVSATGGEPTPLTTGSYNDGNPTFFPSGDRIAFLSDRPSAPGTSGTWVMVMPFDTRHGRAGGIPRQVSLETTMGYTLDVSPDGEWIAYTVRDDTVRKVMAVPSGGGTARTLASLAPSVYSVQNLAWSGDGRFVYFSVRHRGAEAWSNIMRARLTGGTADSLGTTGHMAVRAIFPDRDLMLLQNPRTQGDIPSYAITTLAGQHVARFETARYTLLGLDRLAPDGRTLVAARSNLVAPVRVVPVAGGPVRQVTEAREYDWAVGWSADGSHLYVSTRSNGQAEILRLPVAGGPATRWAVPWTSTLEGVSPDGRYVRTMGWSEAGRRTLEIGSLQDARTRVVTDMVYFGPGWLQGGPGGSATNEGEFVYLELHGDRLELRSTPPEGSSRLIRTFPASYVGSSFSLHGSRIAYRERRGDSTAVFVASGADGPARHVVTVAGNASWCVWSHDGRQLACDHYPPGEGSRHDVLLIGVGFDGSLTGPPRTLESGAQWGWQIQWLPDDRALTVFGMTGVANETHVFMVSLREGEKPVCITRDDPSIRWGYSLSPDGRYVAYAAEIPRGSSIWRVDLGDVLAGSGNPR
jgi:Tol biopolymer transport system component